MIHLKIRYQYDSNIDNKRTRLNKIFSEAKNKLLITQFPQ